MTDAAAAASQPRAETAAAGRRLALIPSWPYLIALAAFGRLLVDRRALLNDPDTYMHIAAGRWMLAHHALPVQDPFSHSMPGAAWLSGEWLAQLLLAVTYDSTGWSGVVLLAAAADALAVGLLLHFLLRRLEAVPALIAAIAAAALLQPHALVRPHVLALPLLAAWAGLLLGARDAGRGPPFAALPLMALWANLHGSFMFGLAFAGYIAAEAVWLPRPGVTRRREAVLWGGFGLAAAAMALLTPHGVWGLVQPLRLMQMPALQTTFAEWLSPDFQKAPALEFWMLAMVFVGYATGLRLPMPRLLLLLGLVHMTLQHVRHGDVLAIVVPLALAAPLGHRLAELAPPSPMFIRAARLAKPARPPAMLVALALGAMLSLPSILAPIRRADDAVTPASALAAAQRLGLSGPVFNSEGFGGYLLFRGVPTLIDGRIEMYGNDFLARSYAAERGQEPELADLLAAYHISWALLLPHSGAALALANRPGWREVYADAYAVVFRRQ